MKWREVKWREGKWGKWSEVKWSRQESEGKGREVKGSEVEWKQSRHFQSWGGSPSGWFQRVFEEWNYFRRSERVASVYFVSIFRVRTFHESLCFSRLLLWAPVWRVSSGGSETISNILEVRVFLESYLQSLRRWCCRRGWAYAGSLFLATSPTSAPRGAWIHPQNSPVLVQQSVVTLCFSRLLLGGF